MSSDRRNSQRKSEGATMLQLSIRGQDIVLNQLIKSGFSAVGLKIERARPS